LTFNSIDFLCHSIYLDLAKALFQAVDQNHNGSLDFTDLMALTAIINKLSAQFGGVEQ
jgi:hypothetical protein